MPIGEDWVQASRNFANKIWNATRFALMNGATIEGELPPAERLSATDRWILSRLNTVVAEADAYYDDYQFAKLADALYHFAWDEVFDWYVELSKTTFMAGGDAAGVSTTASTALFTAKYWCGFAMRLLERGSPGLGGGKLTKLRVRGSLSCTHRRFREFRDASTQQT